MYSDKKTTEFNKKIKAAIENSTVDLLKIADEKEDYKLAVVSKNRIEVLTKTQKELIELLGTEPKTGAELSRLTGHKDLTINPQIKPKSPQFISRYMDELEDWGIVAKIDAPFGHAKVYVLIAKVFDKDELKKVQTEAIPDQIKSELVNRGIAGNLMSLSFKEILNMIRDLGESEKQKVLDFIIEYCQVEED
ncbi:MAG: hypothetical protein FK730_11505 [Asgard group archaeon]|nr:hypothetical protein [Asgard group archaeon]